MTAITESVLVPLVVSLVRVAVIIFTFFTWPLYYLLQQPWRRLHIAKHCGAHLVNKGRLSKSAPHGRAGANFIEFERFAEVPYHPLMDCQTLPEAINMVMKLYPLDQTSHGYREILEEQVQFDAQGNPIRVDGKVLRKYKLSDYRWLSLGEVCERIYSLGRGMVAIGLKKTDRAAIYAETSVNFFTSLLGLEMYGGVAVTLFHTLNNESLIHCLNETESKYMLTSFELLDRVVSFIDRCPKVQHIIYFEGK